MPNTRVLALTALAMLAFAGNSVLCRLALAHTAIDPATFTLVRVLSGAALLALLASLRNRPGSIRGSWPAALALLGYLWWFSHAYTGLETGAGALILFGSVQIAMLTYGLIRGERPGVWQMLGLASALGGFVWLLLPGISAPPPAATLLMMGAGVAWAGYTVLGKGNQDSLGASAGNFALAAVLTLALYLVAGTHVQIDTMGLVYAVLSGALASGAGYAIWYAALRDLTAIAAASVQLSVPLLAALAGVAFLHEPLTARLVMAGALILGGILLVMFGMHSSRRAQHG